MIKEAALVAPVRHRGRAGRRARGLEADVGEGTLRTALEAVTAVAGFALIGCGSMSIGCRWRWRRAGASGDVDSASRIRPGDDP